MNQARPGPSGDERPGDPRGVTISCHEAVSEVYLYLDGELQYWERVVEAHLESCPNCNTGYEFEIRLRERIRTACDEQPPAALAERIRQALGQL